MEYYSRYGINLRPVAVEWGGRSEERRGGIPRGVSKRTDGRKPRGER